MDDDQEVWDGTSIFDLPSGNNEAQQPEVEAIQLGEGVEILIEPSCVAVWGSARLLAAWLLTVEGRALVNNHTVLEVGAGLGLPSIASAIAGSSRAVATDMSQNSVDALQRLLRDRYNGAPWAERVHSYSLNWNDCTQQNFVPSNVADVVIAADCHYYRSALEPLVATIQCHLQPCGTLVLASREGRISLDESRQLLVQRGFVELESINLRSEALQLGLDDDHFATLYRAPGGPSAQAIDLG